MVAGIFVFNLLVLGGFHVLRVIYNQSTLGTSLIPQSHYTPGEDIHG